jgi:hypothetical protein
MITLALVLILYSIFDIINKTNLNSLESSLKSMQIENLRLKNEILSRKLK